MALLAGRKAPDFSLPDETGKIHSLSDYLGQFIVLYFYPKDDTPGCTLEACNFRDEFSTISKEEAIILGISADSQKSHQKFITKYDLPFHLLSDDQLIVVREYEVWGQKKFMGKEYEGILRTTYLVDKQGFIAKVFINVKPANHIIEVASALRELRERKA